MTLSFELQLMGDSTACKGVLSREGVGKLKHISVKQLWLQEKIAAGRIAFEKIDRSINSADAMTKHWKTADPSHFHRMDFYTIPASS